ncbi:hypothetical protein M514_04978 [Trichuris suis]|uniref:Cyclin N-terminal domain-containing protein n=1 Tax=Trichuris suis TaxID=68888 RepID=A0A085MAF5_9BILA|nr:hypothetical protein M513_04978 [Trichuris suis]KFD71174.1 hypothetical protein M514_04978 [Trichuris suis]
MENESTIYSKKSVRRAVHTPPKVQHFVETKTSERKRRALEVLSDNTGQNALDSFVNLNSSTTLRRKEFSGSLRRTDNLAQPSPRIASDNSLADDVDFDGVQASRTSSFLECEDSVARGGVVVNEPSPASDCSKKISVRNANKLLKKIRIDSTTTSFSDHFHEKDEENEHNESFDSVIDRTERRDSIGSSYTTSATSYNENSPIDLTCSTSPVKPRPQASWDVIVDNHAFNRLQEVVQKVPPNYMSEQDELDARMRSILVDWLVDVCLEFNFCQETLHVGVTLTDRFLAGMNVSKDKLQLVGVVGVMVASKLEEIYPPKVKDFAAITDETYTVSEVLKMERIMLDFFHFKVHPPTVNEFIATYTHVSGSSTRTHFLAMYLGDMALQRYEFLRYLPSQIGASSVWMSLGICESDWYNKDLKTFCNYDLTVLLPIMERLLDVWKNNCNEPLRAIQQKYTSDKFYSVGLIVPPRSLPF